MRRRDFQRLVDSLKSLSPHQLHQLNETVSGLVQKNEVRALIARQVEQSGQCPYCDAKEFRRWACPVCSGWRRNFPQQGRREPVNLL